MIAQDIVIRPIITCLLYTSPSAAQANEITNTATVTATTPLATTVTASDTATVDGAALSKVTSSCCAGVIVAVSDAVTVEASGVVAVTVAVFVISLACAAEGRRYCNL